MKPKTKTLLAALGVLALVLALPLGLMALQTADNAAMFSAPHPRALATGETAPNAAADPMIAALWDKAEFYDGTNFANVTYAYQPVPHNNRLEKETYAALAAAGVLPAQACEDAMETAGGDGVSFKEGPAFTWRNGLLLFDDKLAVSAGAALPKGTRLDFDFAAAAKGYVDYLGLGWLGDWRPATLYLANNTAGAALYSESAQLLVQVRADYRTPTEDYGCMVSPIRREDLAKLELAV